MQNTIFDSLELQPDTSITDSLLMSVMDEKFPVPNYRHLLYIENGNIHLHYKFIGDHIIEVASAFYKLLVSGIAKLIIHDDNINSPTYWIWMNDLWDKKTVRLWSVKLANFIEAYGKGCIEHTSTDHIHWWVYKSVKADRRIANRIFQETFVDTITEREIQWCVKKFNEDYNVGTDILPTAKW